MHADKNIHPNTFITKSNIFIRSTKCWQYVYFSSFVEEDIISTLEIPLCWAFLKVLPPLFALGSCHPKSDLWEKPQPCESQIFSMTAVWKQCRSTEQCVFMKIAKTNQIVLDKSEINVGNRKQWTLCVPDKPDWPGFHLTIQFSIAVIFNNCAKCRQSVHRALWDGLTFTMHANGSTCSIFKSITIHSNQTTRRAV